MRAGKHIMAALAVALVAASPLLADTRKANIDVILALDKSLSMENKIGAVKTWVNSFILDQLIIPGDTLTVVAFYGKADVAISQTIATDADRSAAKATISKIQGNGRFTDIGNALDVLKAQLAEKETDGRDKYVLLLTDGIQEAPPSSKYWSKNGEFNHDFLASTKTIQQKGWKVMILGIGIDTAAKQLAKELQGSYSEITNPSSMTPETIAKTAGTLFGMPSVEGKVTLGAVNSNGSSALSFSLKPSGMAGDVNITINDVSVQAGSRSLSSLLASPATITVKNAGSTPVRIPLQFPPGMPPGRSPATLTFSFGSTERFAPAQAPVDFQVMGWLQSNVPMAAGGLVVLLVLAALIVLLLLRLAQGSPVRFAVLVDDEPVQEEPVVLRPGHELFLNDMASVISLAQRRTGKSVAKFSVTQGKLGLGVIKEDRFPKLKDLPPDARGKSFVLHTESGQNVTLKIQSKERKK